jgi:cell division protein FtsB
MLKIVLQSRWFTFLAVIAIGFFLLLIIKLQPSLETITKETDNLDQKIAEVEKNSLEMEKIRGYLNSADYLERQARIKLNYKKPDESAVFVYQNPHQKPAETNGAEKLPEILPNWQKWLNYLLNE